MLSNATFKLGTRPFTVWVKWVKRLGCTLGTPFTLVHLSRVVVLSHVTRSFSPSLALAGDLVAAVV